jgi:GNAT superfamily N-acetyltransferase
VCGDELMSVTYYKRFRMEIDLEHQDFDVPELPDGYVWTAWNSQLLERHALTKYESFRCEIDSDVFPCLGDRVGCRNLMSEIVQRATFVPQATWLISHVDGSRATCAIDDCATIQGVIQSGRWGAVQNVGVAPTYRGLGLGRALVLKSLCGFIEAGVSHVYLEVTARNMPAVQLYRSIGFRLARTTYKAVEQPSAAYAVL